MNDDDDKDDGWGVDNNDNIDNLQFVYFVSILNCEIELTFSKKMLFSK